VKGSRDTTGRRVLNSTQSHLSLLMHHFSLPQKAFSGIDPKLKLNDNRILIPTILGSYRIKKQVSQNGNDYIEFWRESAVKPIPRPPEGWDDLGVGGAEIQGRWAWGKEKKSLIEKGISQRKSFFENKHQYKDNFCKWLLSQCSWSTTYLLLKATFLIVSSWLIALLFMCTTISLPLFVGRSMYSLLRVENKYIHDPFAFPIGMLSIVLLLLQVKSSFKMERFKVKLTRFFSRTLRQRLTASKRKIYVIFNASTVWFLLTPLVLGVEFDLFFFMNFHDNPNLKTFTNARFMLLIWKNGLALLHIWAILCHIGVFQHKFWRDRGFLNARDGNLRQNDDGKVLGRDNAVDTWQGDNGVIRRYVNVMFSVIIDGNWEKVEGPAVMDECITPIFKNTLISLIIPICISSTFIFLVDVAFGFSGIISMKSPLMKIVIYRLCFIMTVTVQLGKVFKSPIQRWYRVAHKAARDDMYLVGKTLVNYAQREENDN